MTQIFPYIGFGLLGLIGGLAVNSVVEWFYLRRRIYSDESANKIKQAGWGRLLLWPGSIKGVEELKPFRIVFVNFVFILAALWLRFEPPEKVEFYWGFPLLVYFAIVVVMDLEYRVVLHPVSIAGAVIGLAFGTWVRGDFIFSVLGGVVGFGVMYIFYQFGELFVRWMSKRRGQEIEEVALGFGDVNIAGVIGLMLGWPGIVLGLFVAIMTGGLVSLLFMLIMGMLRRLKAFSAIPYAPFLVFGAFVLLYFRVFLDSIVN